MFLHLAAGQGSATALRKIRFLLKIRFGCNKTIYFRSNQRGADVPLEPPYRSSSNPSCDMKEATGRFQGAHQGTSPARAEQVRLLLLYQDGKEGRPDVMNKPDVGGGGQTLIQEETLPI